MRTGYSWVESRQVAGQPPFVNRVRNPPSPLESFVATSHALYGVVLTAVAAVGLRSKAAWSVSARRLLPKAGDALIM